MLVNCEKMIVFSSPSPRASISASSSKILRTFADVTGRFGFVADIDMRRACRTITFSHASQFSASGDAAFDSVSLEGQLQR